MAHTTPPMPPDALAGKTGDAARLLRALSHEARLATVCILAEGEHAVSALHARVPLSQSALSQHLAVLRREGLVTTRREAQTIYYRLSDARAQSLVGVLHELLCSEAGEPTES